MKVSRDQVDNLFPEIVDKLGYNKEESDLEWLDSLMKSLSGMGPFFKVLFICAFIAIIIFIIYRIVLSLAKNSKSLHKNAKINDSNVNKQLQDILDDVSRLKNNKKFTLAAVFLHHATMHYLLEKDLLEYNRDYTNKEIFNLLENTNFLTSFKTIALRSQGILFNNEEVDENDFLELENYYNEVFND